MTAQETLYTITLSLTPGIGLIARKTLLETFGSATAVFENRHKIQDTIPSAHPRLVESVANMDKFLKRAEEEMAFAEKGHVQTLGLLDEKYPKRLTLCTDAPIVLYYRGTSSLNEKHIVSMVGTRDVTDYGKDFCARFVGELHDLCPDVLLVSGLAYGVDTQCHRAALKNGIDTIGVLAHGLEQIYPATHRGVASEMTCHGGLLTEFVSHTKIDKMNFIRRNRIVAGMSDATIVVESAEKGGALTTAELANGYDREVFAVPGRVYDAYSKGCNHLIVNNKACLLEDASQFVNAMGWQTDTKRKKALKNGVQQEMFVTLTEEEKRVVNYIPQGENANINILAAKTGFHISKLSSLLFSLEMKGVVRPVVGGSFRLV